MVPEVLTLDQKPLRVQLQQWMQADREDDSQMASLAKKVNLGLKY